MNSQPHFHKGLFTLIIYNMIIKQKMVRTARWKLRNKATATLLASELKVEDVKQAITAARIARGAVSPEAYRGRQLLSSIDAICRVTPHSNQAARCAKKTLKQFNIIMVVLPFFLQLLLMMTIITLFKFLQMNQLMKMETPLYSMTMN
jgi:hypothetical protein